MAIQPYTTAPVTSSLRRTLDLPVWEWVRFSPIATAAGFCTCTSEVLNDRYIYYITTGAAPATFYRYDTYTDGWQQLAPPNTALLTVGDMQYVAFNGFRCKALSGSTASTLVMPALTGQVLSGSAVKIMEGTGRGQVAVISAVSDPIMQDQGVLTTATANQLTDSTKKWKFNQWVGYQVRLVYDAGASQVRNVLYNDATNLYLSDTNYQQIDSWNNTGFSAQSPFALPVSTAGSQTYYVIEASNVSLVAPFGIAPDVTSKLVVQSGGIFLLSGAAAAPFFTLQYYDVAEDSWTTKTATQTILAVAATDCALEKFVEGGGVFDNGFCGNPTGSLFFLASPSASVYDYTNTGSAAWIADRFVDYQCRIVSGSGQGQRRRIIAMTGSSFQVVPNFNPTIDSSSVYQIYGDTDKMMMTIGGNTAMFQYQIEPDLWTTGDMSYTGLARNWSAQWFGSASYEPIALSTIVKNTGAVISMSAIPVTGGSGYFVGDVFNLTTGGTNGKGRVNQVGFSASLSSSALGVEIYAVGSGYTPGTSATTNILGNGAGLTVQIVTTGSAGRVTTAINHFFQRNDSVTIQGTTDATWNIPFTILGADSLTTFDITGSLTAAPTAVSSSLPSTFVDSNMSWAPNELVGKLIHKYLVGTTGTSEVKRIVGNTGNTVSVVSTWAATPVNGTSRYAIYESRGFGRDEQYRVPSLNGRGYATSGSLTTPSSSMLFDPNHNWSYNQWSSSIIRFVGGTGTNNECLIYTNNSQSLSFYSSSIVSASVVTPGVVVIPDTSSKYIIFDSFGIATAVGSTTSVIDYTKNWTNNQWAGKYVRFIGGTDNGVAENKVASNTNNTLTLTTTMGAATATDTSYVIYGEIPRSTGIETIWAFGNTLPNQAGKYIWCPTGGGSNKFGRYDITQQLWDYGIFIQPISEQLNTGTMYCYDGVNRIYFTVNATGRVFYLDITSNKVMPYGVTPYAHGAAAIGNRMEIIQSPDGFQFLVIFRQTGQEVWRSLIVI